MSTDAEVVALRGAVTRLDAEVRALSAQQSLSKTLLETVPAAVMRVTLEGVIEYINRRGPRYQGIEPVGRSVYSFAAPAQHPVMRAALETAARTRSPTSYELVIAAPDGTREWYLSSVGPIIEGDRVTGLVLVSTDVTQVRAAEAALRESQASLELALTAADVGLWRWDRRTDTVQWDERTCALFGVPPAAAPRTVEAYLALLPADEREAMGRHVQRALETGVYPDFELRLEVDGEVRWLVIRGGVLRDEVGEVAGLLGAVVDATARRRAEEALQQRQKLEAVGQLSAGVAHNFNNMLAVILPALEIARDRARPPEAELLEDALTSAAHAAQLVRDLMVFSRGRAPGAARRETLADVVRRAVELCQRTFEKRVTIELGDLTAARACTVDGAALEQAVMNLLLNARDALADTGGRPARISVAARLLPADGRRQGHPQALGDCVELRVVDTGCGLDEATQRRMFEPFFTTKPAGRGTGLGLSTAWATVRAHQGLLECESRLGEGTTFTLVLPAVGGVAERTTPAHGARVAAPRTQTVLVIDDEDPVRRATARLLEAEGFVVRTAASGAAGVAEAARGGVDVVLLDYSMPGLSAEDTLAALKAARPALPVVSLSGLGATLDGASAHLLKPVTRETLLATLERVLAVG